MVKGFGGEAARAYSRAWQRIRALIPLALVAVLVGIPGPAFLGGGWSASEPDALVALDHPLNTPIPTVAPTPRPVVRLAPAPRARPAARAPVPSAAAAGGRWVHASWYGPGFYGNRTACGQTYTPASWGIAHKTLGCGTTVSITHAGRTVSAPVIDRGPYIAGREVDLSAALAQSLGFAGVHVVYLVIH